MKKILIFCMVAFLGFLGFLGQSFASSDAKDDLYIRKPNSYQGLYASNTGKMEIRERKLTEYVIKFDNGNFDFKGKVVWKNSPGWNKKITIIDDKNNGVLMEITFSGDVAAVHANPKFKKLEGEYARIGVAPIGVPTEQFLEICKTGTPEQIQSAINLGVELNATGEEGHAALVIAGWFNPNPEVITLLVKAGADLNQEYDDEMTAFLYAAVANPNPEVINAFLKAGSDVNAPAAFGQTALMLAAAYNNGEVVEALLKAGAGVNVKEDEYGKRAIDFAETNEKLKGTAAYQKLKELSGN